MEKFLSSIIPIPTPHLFIVGGLTTFIFGCICHAGRNYIKASEEFRNVIYTNLEGIYPEAIAYISHSEKTARTHNSINTIYTAGIKFQHFLPFFCVNSFNKALTCYCETAKKTNWHDEILRGMYPSCADSGESPKDQFEKAITNLLKFAK